MAGEEEKFPRGRSFGLALRRGQQTGSLRGPVCQHHVQTAFPSWASLISTMGITVGIG